jgi:hypothetical protein
MVIPDQDLDFMFLPRGNRADVRLSTHTIAVNILRTQGTGTNSAYAFGSQQTQPAKSIQHRFVYSIGGQRAEALKVGLVFEFKGPGYGAHKINALAAG